MIEYLRRFEPFADMDWLTLKTVCRHTRILELPAGRWLVRPGRVLNGRYYLLSGKVRTVNPDGVLRRCPRPLYPGNGGIMTLTPVQLLCVDTGPIAFLFAHSTGAQAQGVDPDPESWQVRFLRSHLLAGLSPQCWQQVLRALEPRELVAGVEVITSGTRGDSCYILARGRADVVRAGKRLRSLGPGDFFGEDALLSGARRNATVTMLTAGEVMALDEAHFRRWLVDSVVQSERVGSAGLVSNLRDQRLQVSVADDVRDVLEALDPCARYRVAGPPEVAALAVFLLRQRGVSAVLDVSPLAG